MIRDLVHQSATMRTNNNLKINDDHKLSDRIKEKPLAVTASTLRGESEQRNFHAILDSAEVHYDSAWRLDNTLFSALVGLIKVQINKNRYERAFSIFQTETTEMGWDLKNVVFFQTLENTEFGHDNEVINKRMDFLYDLFSHLAANQRAGNEQLTYAALRLLRLSDEYEYSPEPALLTNLIAGIEESLQKNPDPDISLVLGSHFLRKGSADTLRAIKHFDRIDDGGQDTLRQRGTSYDLSLVADLLLQSYGQTYHAKAAEYLKSALEFNPQSASARTLLGQYYYKYEDYERAYTQFKKAANVNPSKEIFHDLGLSRQQLKDWPGAETFYLKALKDDPSNKDYLEHLANIYYNLNRNEDAISVYDRILLIEPENEDALHLKQSASKLGQVEGSLQNITSVARIMAS